ncbi:MAG TPA: cysteine rich repeat-containing protein [Drouetiella sp.]
MLKIATLALALTVAGTLAAPAFAHSGSSDDQAACTPDVFRLCSSEIPNESRIVACLMKNKAKLSPACAAVFNRKK